MKTPFKRCLNSVFSRDPPARKVKIVYGDGVIEQFLSDCYANAYYYALEEAKKRHTTLFSVKFGG